MTWAKLSDSLSWTPGHAGKGYLLHDGTIKSWNVDPFMPLDHHEVHQRDHEFSPIALNFEIDPDGGIVTEQQTPKVESIVQADPRLYDAGQRPVWEDRFDLDQFEPKSDKVGKPDFNFVMSMALEPDAVNQYVQEHGPYLEHWTRPESVPGILRNGIQPATHPTEDPDWEDAEYEPPGSEDIRRNWDGFLETRPGYTYLARPGTINPGMHENHLKQRPYQVPVRVDLRKLNPQQLEGDEDSLRELWPDLQRHMLEQEGAIQPGQEVSDDQLRELMWKHLPDTLEPPDAQFYEPDEYGQGYGLGQWAEDVYAGDPEFTRRSLMDSGSIAHQGTVPPEAISLHPDYMDRYPAGVEQLRPHQMRLFEGRNSSTVYEQIADLRQGLPQNIQAQIDQLLRYQGPASVMRYLQQFTPPPEPAGEGSPLWDWMHGAQELQSDSYTAALHATHRNRWTGKLCQCGWGPQSRRLSKTAGLELRRLMKAPDKAYRTPGGQAFRDHLAALPEEHDSLLPYLARRWKQGDIRLGGPERDKLEYLSKDDLHGWRSEEPRWWPLANHLPQWQQWYEARQHPTRRGVDVMDPDFTPEAMNSAVSAHQQQLAEARQRENWLAINPSGSDIGHMQGSSGYPKNDYRDLISTFNTTHGLPDREGSEEELEPVYERQVQLPEPEDVDGYLAQYGDDADLYALADGFNIGEGTEIIPGRPYWPRIAADYLRLAPNNIRADFFSTLRQRYNSSEFATALARAADLSDPDEREAVAYWNSEGAQHPSEHVDIPPQEPTEVDEYNEALDNGQEVAPDWDAMAGDYLRYHEAYGTWRPDGRNEYGVFHDALRHNDEHHQEMHDALQNRIDWDDPDHQQAIKWWNDFSPQNVVPPPETPQQIPGQMQWDWPRGWSREQNTEGYNWNRGGDNYVVPNNSLYIPRSSSWHLADGPYGYTNWDTSKTALMIDNDRPLHDKSRKLVEQGATPEQLRDWATKRVIGPYNKEQIKDAKEWNAIPLEERKRRLRERDIGQFGEAAVNMGESLMQPFNDWNNEGKSEEEIQREEEYDAPDLIDPEMVNWDEIHQGILDEFEENGLGWVTNHDLPTNQMRDAMYRFRGLKPEDDDAHRHKVSVPWEHFRQMETNPENWLSLDSRGAVGDALRKEQIQQEVARMQADPRYADIGLEELHHLAEGITDRHFQWWRDQEYNWDDARFQHIFDADPRVQEIRQQGYQQPVTEHTWDLIHDIWNGRENPYTEQMTQALQQRGYTPEQIAQLTAQRWRWDPELNQRLPVDATPPVEQWADSSQDQPGDTYFPSGWTSRRTQANATYPGQCPQCGANAVKADYGQTLQHCLNCGAHFDPLTLIQNQLDKLPAINVQYPNPWADHPSDSAAPQHHGSDQHILAPAVELREWLADLGEAEPQPSIHHQDELDFIQAPPVSTANDLPYFPPANVPKEYKQAKVKNATTRSLYHGTLLDNLASIKDSGLLPDLGDFTSDAYGFDDDGLFHQGDEDPYTMEELGVRPVVHMTDKRDLDKALTAIRHNVAMKLGLDFHGVTPQHVQSHGLLVKEPGQMGWSDDPRSDNYAQLTQVPSDRYEKPWESDPEWQKWHQYDEHPYQSEPGDYYSDSSVGSDDLQFLHGPAMMRVFRPQGLLDPQNWGGGIGQQTVPDPRGTQYPGEATSSTKTADEADDAIGVQHKLWWKPSDGWGFGLVHPDGTVYTWPETDRQGNFEMNHSQRARALGIPWQQARAFYCDPDDRSFVMVDGSDETGRHPLLDHIHQATGLKPDPVEHEPYYTEHQAGFAKLADSPINQADATNDPLGKNPAIIPSRQGDPDYLEVSICPNCQQPHRPDEPCPDNSVTQYKQMQRQWGNRDPNSTHQEHPHGPSGLQDHQMDLGRLAAMTLPQLQRQWQGLNEQHPNTSELVQRFPNGWSIQRATTPEDVKRVGKHMRNCWQGHIADPEDWIERWAPHALHDEHDHPMIAFHMPSFPTRAFDDQSVGRDVQQPWGHHNNPPSPEAAEALTNWAEQNNYAINGHDPDGWLDDIQSGTYDTEPQLRGRMARNNDPTICEDCGNRMTEPKMIGNKWMNHCLYCGMTREVSTASPLLQSQRQQEELSPYPDLLNQVGPSRAWSFGKVADYDHEDSLIGTATTLVETGMSVDQAAQWLEQALVQSGRAPQEAELIADEVFMRR